METIINWNKHELKYSETPFSVRENNHYVELWNEKVWFDWHYNPISIDIKESNYIKESELSWNEIRKQCIWKLSINGIQIYECFARWYSNCYKRIERCIEKLEIFDIDEFISWKCIWRKVWYKEQIFIIDSTIVQQWCLMLKHESWKRKPFLYEYDDIVEDFELEELVKVEFYEVDWYVE